MREKDLSDIYLFSDFDGTIRPVGGTIPPENLVALERFVARGGHFGLATGRSPQSAKQFLKVLPINAPCLCINGAAVYDMLKDEYLYAECLPPVAKEYALRIMEEHPEWDAAVVTRDEYYFIDDPAVSINRVDKTHALASPRFSLPIPEGWLKVIFYTRDHEASPYVNSLNPEDFPGVTFTTSDHFFVEILSDGVSKGAAIEAICDRLQLDISQTVAVGDYYNDVEMLKAAGFSACVDGAPEDIKAMVNTVLCSCEDGAIAQLVSLLEEKYGRQ